MSVSVCLEILLEVQTKCGTNIFYSIIKTRQWLQRKHLGERIFFMKTEGFLQIGLDLAVWDMITRQKKSSD